MNTKLRTQKLIYFLCFVLFFAACSENTEPENKAPYQAENQWLNETLQKRVNLLPQLTLDSLRIENDTLSTYFTDDYATHYNQVLVTQNVATIFQDFPQIATAPFSFVKVFYQIPKRDSSGYFTLSQIGLAELKASLHLFTNPPFQNLVNGINAVHKKYPEKQVINGLNTILAEKLHKDEGQEFQFFGADYLDVASMYLAECENQAPGYFKDMVDHFIEKLAQDTIVGEAVAAEVKGVFDSQCAEIQEMNPIK